MNLHTNINQKSTNRQPAQHILKSGQKVYLYGDTRFSGTLIRPIERTYPPRWTVQLDRGGYDSATVAEITPINPQYIETKAAVLFNDSLDTTLPYKEQISVQEKRISELERENEILRTQLKQLQAEKEILEKDLAQAKQVIRRAKDISPLMRISLKRVLRLAKDACMNVQRTVGGWILRMGDRARKFRRLADIWDILSQDNWYLEDIFPKDKLVAIDLILPPRPRKPPTLPNKQTLPLMRPEDILRNREIRLVRCG